MPQTAPAHNTQGWYPLSPHPIGCWTENHSILVQGMCTWRQPLFTLEFELTGDLTPLALPHRNPHPKRRDRLWAQTCFEAFIAPKTMQDTHTGYWELNFSPSGDWNLYFFSHYRNLYGPEERIQEAHFREKTWDLKTQRLRVVLDWTPLLTPSPLNTDFSVGLSTVLQDHEGKLGYFALKHCANRPDFHLQESFALRLPGVFASTGY